MLLAPSESKPHGNCVSKSPSLSQSGLAPPDHRPVISICIPTYNGREHLGECINSIRRQTLKNFEVVVCDDHSSDGTLDFARELAQGDERFRFISNPRRLGITRNWNNCVEEARGEWIKFVFQDDTIAPTCLEKLLAACERSGKPFGFCERKLIYEEGTSEGRRNYLDGHARWLHSEYDAGGDISPDQVIRIAAIDPTHNLVGEPTVTLIKRLLFSELGGFDERLIQLCDAEFWCRAMIRYGAAFVPEGLAAFRVHSAGATSRNQQERSYRGEVLDPLVIWYRAAFGSKFKPMRNRRISGVNTFWLRMKCAYFAGEAWKQVRRTRNSEGGNVSLDMLAEWDFVRSRCPGLRLLVGLGLVIGIGRGAKMKLDRLLG